MGPWLRVRRSEFAYDSVTVLDDFIRTLGYLPLYRVILLNIEFSQFSDLAGVTVPVGAMAAMDIVLGKFIYLFF